MAVVAVVVGVVQLAAQLVVDVVVDVGESLVAAEACWLKSRGSTRRSSRSEQGPRAAQRRTRNLPHRRHQPQLQHQRQDPPQAQLLRQHQCLHRLRHRHQCQRLVADVGVQAEAAVGVEVVVVVQLVAQLVVDVAVDVAVDVVDVGESLVAAEACWLKSRGSTRRS